jgi:hypothetical protein
MDIFDESFLQFLFFHISDLHWTSKESEFESLYGQYFSPLHVVQTGPGAQPASYSFGTGGSFPVGKAAGAKLTIHLQLVQRSKIVWLYL